MPTERLHLGRQEELVDESGVQLRDDEPSAPFEGQTWINFTENKMKVYRGGEKVVLVDGPIGNALEIPNDGIINAALSRSFFKSLSADFEITEFQNFKDGLICYLSLNNTNPNIQEETDLTIPSPTSFANGSYFLIDSAHNENRYYVWANIDGVGTDPAIVGRTGVPVLTTAGLPEITDLTFGPASGIASGQHFLINSSLDAIGYYVWFNKDDLGGDPLIGGRTGIQITITNTDTAAVIAEKVRDALDPLPAFAATFLSNVVTVQNTSIGVTTDASNVTVGGLTINVTQQGLNAETPNEFAVSIAAALDALPDFNAPAPGAAVVSVQNANPGFADDAVDGDMGVVVNVTQQGSGRVFLSYPVTVALSQDAENFIEGLQTQVYKLFRSGSYIYMINQGTYTT